MVERTAAQQATDRGRVDHGRDESRRAVRVGDEKGPYDERDLKAGQVHPAPPDGFGIHQIALGVVTEPGWGGRAGHAVCGSEAANLLASCPRARATWVFTVDSATPSRRATSA